ncbi:hypothetical protein [uncultured Gammaproteobacteria bacterium]|nr:hypothetical protein [uncultured Gammaproteobacteria bacterium]
MGKGLISLIKKTPKTPKPSTIHPKPPQITSITLLHSLVIVLFCSI